jgi:hypothetical protein
MRKPQLRRPLKVATVNLHFGLFADLATQREHRSNAGRRQLAKRLAQLEAQKQTDTKQPE